MFVMNINFFHFDPQCTKFVLAENAKMINRDVFNESAVIKYK